MSVTIRLNCDSAERGGCGSEFVYSQGIASAHRTARWEELSITQLRELAELSAGWSTETITETSFDGPARTTTFDFCKEHTHHG